MFECSDVFSCLIASKQNLMLVKIIYAHDLHTLHHYRRLTKLRNYLLKFVQYTSMFIQVCPAKTVRYLPYSCMNLIALSFPLCSGLFQIHRVVFSETLCLISPPIVMHWPVNSWVLFVTKTLVFFTSYVFSQNNGLYN